VQRAAASQERINEFLNEEPQIKNESEEAFEFKGKITFNNVSFTYPTSGIHAIKNLSFEVKKGETLAIIGRTGSGKSSLLNLVLRQFDPTQGEILIDDVPLKEINLEAFRQQSGVVPQEVFLFSDTIKNNVTFGLTKDKDISDEAVIDILKATHVYHNIEQFKAGIHTVLGERGVNLSGGQKQRISIARALIRNPKLLILDDCLSAVDTETEEIILTNLKEHIQNNTTIIVSHRVSSIRNADRILVIADGQKVEEGSHSELLALNGVYTEMYNQQLLEEQEKNNN
jgi:ATP-binding cassette subfamily B protein